VSAAGATIFPEAVIRAELDGVADPEIPAVSIVELGMVEDVAITADAIRVTILPTFVGCPAIEMIRTAVAERLAGHGRPVEVEVSYAVPWTSDRISPAGRDKLRRSGFAPPPAVPAGRALPIVDPAAGASSAAGEPSAEPVACPYCGSLRTTLENAFGPTQCRSIRHCPDCRQPFEAFKAI
jgi:ring-1,2-phenylacetyl-CoA epoxidase subunit PaaD